MAPHEWTALRRWLAILSGLVVVRVLGGILSNYGHYLPAPDFRADFLVGREETFFHGGYREAFVVHLLAGPPALVLALVLANPGLRRRAPEWHARLGRIEAGIVALILAPSGLVMAIEPLPWLSAPERAVAGLGFATLALFTGFSVAIGFAAARQRRFADHGRWMARVVALLLSAVVLRVMGGIASVLAPDLPWTYPASAWASWLLPLLAAEGFLRRNHTGTVSRRTADRRPPA